MKILFLHGWHSVVGGVKPTYLRDHGHEVLNPKLDDDDFEAAIKTAQEQYHLGRPDVIVGSSRGGAVAMNIDSGDTPLVLLCPAWKRWGVATTVKRSTTILHSPLDDVIPYEDSEQLEANSRPLNWGLFGVGDDHRLADAESLSVLLWLCNRIASKEHLLDLDTQSQSLAAPTRAPKGTATEASYICDSCGEEIVIPLDLTAGPNQTYVEDCPVCCRANIIHVAIDEDGDVQLSAGPEQDYE